MSSAQSLSGRLTAGVFCAHNDMILQRFESQESMIAVRTVVGLNFRHLTECLRVGLHKFVVKGCFGKIGTLGLCEALAGFAS